MIIDELVEKGRLEGGEPVLAHADQRRADRLMRAALRRQRDAGRRADEQEAGVLIAGVVQRIEAAGDERVVERADRAAAARRTANATGRRRRAAGTGSSRRCRVRYAGRPARSAISAPRARARRGRYRQATVRANRPRRLTQGPRLVETVTSGEVVTMRSPSGCFSLGDLIEDLAEGGLRRDQLLSSSQ